MLPLGGCLLATDKPDPGLDIPQAYEYGPKNPAVAEVAVPSLDWWHGFRSKELTELIEEARAANLDIAAAVAQIVQADAQARIAGAPLLAGRHPQRQRDALALLADAVERRQRAAAPNTICCRPRSAPATRSTSGARTARPCAPPRRTRSPAAITARWSA